MGPLPLPVLSSILLTPTLPLRQIALHSALRVEVAPLEQRWSAVERYGEGVREGVPEGRGCERGFEDGEGEWFGGCETGGEGGEGGERGAEEVERGGGERKGRSGVPALIDPLVVQTTHRLAGLRKHCLPRLVATPSNISRLRDRDVYFLSDLSESISKYGPGGFHPVHIGETYCEERYKILHKLGQGGLSTVWLARDKQSPSHLQYVALKFYSAIIPESRLQIEFDIYNRLVANGETVQTDPLYAIDVVEALDYLHSRSIAHGDLHAGNLLTNVPGGLAGLAETDLVQKFKYTNLGPILLREGVSFNMDSLPRYLVNPVNLSIHVPPTSLLLVDFGSSFLFDQRRDHLGTPLGYMAPEYLFYKRSQGKVDADWDWRTDIWSLGCALYYIVTGQPLFTLDFNLERALIDDWQMTVGPLPERWQPYVDPPDPKHPISIADETYFVEDMAEELAGDASIPEPRKFADLLSELLVFEPRERISTKEILNHEWITEIRNRRNGDILGHGSSTRQNGSHCNLMAASSPSALGNQNDDVAVVTVHDRIS
ncbi:kinase-like protein [Atractiella rhizophila]|nr:kinase-like protein [Atractiella rhizophila]